MGLFYIFIYIKRLENKIKWMENRMGQRPLDMLLSSPIKIGLVTGLKLNGYIIRLAVWKLAVSKRQPLHGFHWSSISMLKH